MKPFVIILALTLAGCEQVPPAKEIKAEKPVKATEPSRVSRFKIGTPEHPFVLQSGVAPATNAPTKFVAEISRGRVSLQIKLTSTEALWGFGQRFDSLNMRGRTMESWIVDAWGGGNRSYICAPFFISSEGYGLFVNCSGKVKFDCGAKKSDELRIEVPEAGADVFVFSGTPREVLAEYTKLVGRPQPVPEWVFEPWISRNSYLSASEIDRVIEKMEQHGLKASAVVLEAWAEGLQNFRFEEHRYPNPKEWIEKLHAKGYHVVCWETPSIWTSASTYPVAKSNGWLVLNADGSEYVTDWLENGRKIDFRKPEVRAWWTKLHEPLVAMGVDGFKTDGGERAPDPWFHNAQPFYYQRAALEAFAGSGRPGMTFARSASPSCSGNSTFWGGDQACAWNDLPRVVRAGLSAAASGYPLWGHDVGGYAGTPTKNLYIRWLQLGALSPIMQLHGTTPREPWYYDDETVRIAKYYFDLRWKLREYILAAAKAARESATPMWRPLLYEFPNDPATHSIDDEFLFGPDLLVTPVLTEFDERKVYLPVGDWLDVWTKERHTGPKTFTVRPKRAEIPVFARNGAEKFFAPLPDAEPAIALAGSVNERGVVPSRRIWRGQKFEKVFLQVRDGQEVALDAPPGFEVLPSRKQRGERVAFYVTWPEDCEVGTYRIAAGPVAMELVKLPKWNLPVREDGYVDLNKESEATATFRSERDGRARFWMGSGDGMTVWLNGREVFDIASYRAAEPDENVVDVDLKSGENSVLVKVTHGAAAIGPNGFFFRVSGAGAN